MTPSSDVTDVDVPRLHLFAADLRDVSAAVRDRTPDGALTSTSAAMPRSYIAFSHGQAAIRLRRLAEALGQAIDHEAANLESAATRFVRQEEANAAALGAAAAEVGSTTTGAGR